MKNAAPIVNLPWPSDLLDGSKLTMAAAARRVGELTGRSIAPSTCWRWCTHGKGGIHLPHLKFGNRVVTTDAAILWFATACAQASMRPVSVSRPHRATPEAFEQILAEEGL